MLIYRLGRANLLCAVTSGSWAYAANQNTDTIAVFRIQLSNGKLKFSTLVHTPTPVDVEFGPLA